MAIRARSHDGLIWLESDMEDIEECSPKDIGEAAIKGLKDVKAKSIKIKGITVGIVDITNKTAYVPNMPIEALRAQGVTGRGFGRALAEYAGTLMKLQNAGYRIVRHDSKYQMTDMEPDYIMSDALRKIVF